MLTGWRLWALGFGAGLVLALGHAPYDFPWGAILCVPLLVRLLSQLPGARAGAGLGWATGIGYFGLTLTWIVEPFLVDVARHGWMAPFALIFLAAGLALFWALGFGLAARVARGRGVAGTALALALGLTLAEYARSTLLTGFPWALFAYVWLETPVIQLAAHIGPHLLGAGMLLGLGLLGSGRVLPTGAAVLALLGAFALGDLRVSVERALHQKIAQPTPVFLRLVQPNAPQHLKWQPEMLPVYYQRQIAATEAPSDLPLTAVIWPETAVPFLLGERPDLTADIAQAAAGRTPVILGLRRLDEAGNWYNSLAALGPGGEVLAAYDKHHLVPFGEYIPLTGWLERIGLTRLAEGLAGGFHPGPGPVRLALPGLPAFQPLICYEAIFPHEILRGADRPEWLLQITNDAWFGTWSGPYQHLAQARVRAIEQGLPLARAANTGVSAMIDAYGQTTASLALGEQGYVDARLPLPLDPTLYARTPDWLGPLALALALLACGARRARP